MRYLRALVLCGLLCLSACASGGDGQALPTVAQLPNSVTNTPQTNSVTTEADDEPTPTREGEVAIPPTADTVAGAGFGLGQMDITPIALNGAGFLAQIAGTQTLEIKGNGAIGCTEQGAYRISNGAGSTFPRLAFILPPDTPPGTYPILDVVPQGVSIRPVLEVNATLTFDFQLNGVFVLVALPDDSGGRVKAAFEFGVSAISDASESVLVRGGLDFEAPAGFASACFG